MEQRASENEALTERESEATTKETLKDLEDRRKLSDSANEKTDLPAPDSQPDEPSSARRNEELS